MSRAAVQVGLLAVAELLAMTLWFSATAVLPALERHWQLGPTGAAWLTAAVQLGFVAGALASAFLNLPDRIAPRRLFAVSAAAAAAVNLLLAYGVASIGPALALRFLTGAFLAGVYPPGMKIAAGHVGGRGRGLAIGVLVGALTLGSASPHLVAGLAGAAGEGAAGEAAAAAAAWPYREVLAVSSLCALVGAVLVVAVCRDGPFAPPRAPFDPRQLGRVLRDRGIVLANLGYCGHMWELYAMWTWLVTFLAAAAGPSAAREVRIGAFLMIGVAGGIGAVAGGFLADRVGRTTVAIVAMAVSGACCLLSPLAFGAAVPWLVLFGLLWGAAVIADSAQFSAAVTELAEPEYMGTALTLQTSIGFLLTMVTIWGLPLLAEHVGWQYAFVALAPGPLCGCVAMARLRASPAATRLAGGRR